MNKTCYFSLLYVLFGVFLTASVNAEGFIKKEVYSFKDKNGNTIFTDKQPAKSKPFKTQTIEAASSTGNGESLDTARYQYNQQSYTNNSVNKEQVVRVIVEDGNSIDKKSYKKKRTLKRCKSFKKKFNYYSDRLKSGYKNKEYKKLEKNRKKYRNLLFKNCETKTFSD